MCKCYIYILRTLPVATFCKRIEIGAFSINELGFFFIFYYTFLRHIIFQSGAIKTLTGGLLLPTTLRVVAPHRPRRRRLFSNARTYHVYYAYYYYIYVHVIKYTVRISRRPAAHTVLAHIITIENTRARRRRSLDTFPISYARGREARGTFVPYYVHFNINNKIYISHESRPDVKFVIQMISSGGAVNKTRPRFIL